MESLFDKEKKALPFDSYEEYMEYLKLYYYNGNTYKNCAKKLFYGEARVRR